MNLKQPASMVVSNIPCLSQNTLLLVYHVLISTTLFFTQRWFPAFC
jgi:hypothetical protein